jgi:hypothetical protein
MNVDLVERLRENNGQESICQCQALTREAADEIVKLCAVITVAHQALIEVSNAQSIGPWWYTKGEKGLYQQVAMWVGRALESIAALKSKELP